MTPPRTYPVVGEFCGMAHIRQKFFRIDATFGPQTSRMACEARKVLSVPRWGQDDWLRAQQGSMGKGQASLIKGEGTATIIYCEPFHAAHGIGLRL